MRAVAVAEVIFRPQQALVVQAVVMEALKQLRVMLSNLRVVLQIPVAAVVERPREAEVVLV
jgi:hypothetical protein